MDDKEVKIDVQQVHVDVLRPDKKNARLHSKAEIQELERSILELGFHSFIVVQRDTNRVIVGNARLQALKNLGYTVVPVLYVDDDDVKAMVRSVADNRMSDLSRFDESILKDIIMMTKDEYLIPGYTAEDYDKMLGDMLELGDATEIVEEEDPNSVSGTEDGVTVMYPCYSREDIIDAAYDYFLKSGLLIDVPIYVGMQEINRLHETWDDQLLRSVLAYRIPDKYHPARLEMKKYGIKQSINDILRDDSIKFKKMLGYQIDLSEGIPASGKISIALKMSGVNVNYNFRPGLALYYYRRYIDDQGIILDTSMGYGGRLVAAMAHRRCQYIGIDPAIAQYEGNIAIAKDYQFDKMQLICGGAETPEVRKELETYKGKVSLCFTSPPYFNKEYYTTEDAPDAQFQSVGRFPEYQSWLDGFLRPVIQLHFDMLKPGGHDVINIDKVVTDSTYAIYNDLIAIAKEIGFEYVGVEFNQFGGGKLTKSSHSVDDDSEEGFYIFRKPQD